MRLNKLYKIIIRILAKNSEWVRKTQKAAMPLKSVYATNGTCNLAA
jgi:hypothetical protein